jgi:hypothetical protein
MLPGLLNSVKNTKKISQEISATADFSRNLGISPEDAKLALAHTTEALLNSELFDHPTRLSIDDDIYLVRREADQLIVQPVACLGSAR